MHCCNFGPFTKPGSTCSQNNFSFMKRPEASRPLSLYRKWKLPVREMQSLQTLPNDGQCRVAQEHCNVRSYKMGPRVASWPFCLLSWWWSITTLIFNSSIGCISAFHFLSFVHVTHKVGGVTSLNCLFYNSSLYFDEN